MLRSAALSILFGALGTGGLACACAMAPLPVDPVDASRRDVYAGKGKAVEVSFRNLSERAEVDVFPEPPMTLRRLRSGRVCEVDGGAWARRSLHLSTDERVLLVQEYSGSNDRLVFYDTATCKRRAEIDVSGAQWSVGADRIVVQRERGRTTYTLDARCIPRRLAAAVK